MSRAASVAIAALLSAGFAGTALAIPQFDDRPRRPLRLAAEQPAGLELPADDEQATASDDPCALDGRRIALRPSGSEADDAAAPLRRRLEASGARVVAGSAEIILFVAAEQLSADRSRVVLQAADAGGRVLAFAATEADSAGDAAASAFEAIAASLCAALEAPSDGMWTLDLRAAPAAVRAAAAGILAAHGIEAEAASGAPGAWRVEPAEGEAAAAILVRDLLAAAALDEEWTLRVERARGRVVLEPAGR